jgi:hypothetical protein
MAWWLYLLYFGLLVTGTYIIFQDFKSRRIQLYLIILFTIFNWSSYLLTHSLTEFGINTLFCICYLLLCYGCLHLYFYFKTKTFQILLDKKIGWGDVLSILSIGPCMALDTMVYFFSIAFTLTLLIYMLVMAKKSTSIPLAGFLILFYLMYLFLVTPFLHQDELIPICV